MHEKGYSVEVGGGGAEIVYSLWISFGNFMQSVVWLEFAESGFGQEWYYFEKYDQFRWGIFFSGYRNVGN